MIWRRQELVLAPPRNAQGLWHTHVQMPVLYRQSDENWRLFFSGRDEKNRTHGFAAELSIGARVSVIRESGLPVLLPGAAGTFDQDGAMPSALIERDGMLWLYYVGWRIKESVPFETNVGLAVSRDGGYSFERVSDRPVLGLSQDDPISVSSPLVIEHNGDLFMYYSSIETWTPLHGKLEPSYSLKLATSRDGINWNTAPRPVIPLASESESGLTRPTILQHDGVWHMWFSCRGRINYRNNPQQAYRLAYAWSRDGLTWRRADALTKLLPSPLPGQWDSVMQAYPAVIRQANRVLCFYSGNGFGQAGLGYATLDGGLSGLPSAVEIDATT